MNEEDRVWLKGQKLMCDGDEAHNRCEGCQNVDERGKPIGYCGPSLKGKSVEGKDVDVEPKV